MRLLDKVAIVTGGARGIGRAIVFDFMKEGARVLVADKNISGTDGLMRRIKEMKGEAIIFQMDVTKVDQVDQMAEKCVGHFGRIDVLVNNAGIIMIDPVVDMEEKDWDITMEVNAKGVFLCSRAVARQMIKQSQGGKIVNISSLCGKVGYPYMGHYCASKFAVIGLTKTMALELAPYKINVNAVCPGVVETDILVREWDLVGKLDNKTPDQMRKEVTPQIPLGYLAKPEDVSKVVVFLASPDANYMTGQALNVTGGMETH